LHDPAAALATPGDHRGPELHRATLMLMRVYFETDAANGDRREGLAQ